MQITGIRKVAVLGAGVMGGRLAAHLANAGIPSFLLDIVPPDLHAGELRSVLALRALERLPQMEPSPLMHPDNLRLITPGNLEDDWACLAQVDWVLEAVVEQLSVKQQLWARVGQVARPGTVLSSNTSGLSIAAQASALPSQHRPYFLGTHFFNPPRFLKLLELIPTSETDPEVVSFLAKFAERKLGKGVVIANDTPNFIANRIGSYSLAVTLHAMEELGLSVEEVDALTGPLVGRPASATFRTLDLVGLDTILRVLQTGAATAADPREREILQPPGFLQGMLERGWIGDKVGQGFYKRSDGAAGETGLLSLDVRTLEYGPRKKLRFASLARARSLEDLGERLRTLINAEDAAGAFLWRVLSQTFAFCASTSHEIANGDLNAVERAVRWGFNWEMGPFETWNALGVKETCARIEAEGLELPDWVRDIKRFPLDRIQEQPLSFSARKVEPQRVVRTSPGATLVDLGDEVLGLEFHGPSQALGPDYMAMVRAAADEVRRRWRGLVISASGPNFCVGANLMLMVTEARKGNWDALDEAIREFQDVNILCKHLERPVVVAPHGITTGGGAEIAMHCARTVAAAETHMGPVEGLVGVIPAGGGTTEALIRCTVGSSSQPGELIDRLLPAFRAIATSRVSTSAAEARELGYLRPTDEIVMNRDHLLQHAKESVLAMDAEGYHPLDPVELPIGGAEVRAAMEREAERLASEGTVTEHDVYIARKLAYVLSGGDRPAGGRSPAQYFLDLEREAFLHLCGMQKTQQRMLHMMINGTPLRN